MATRRGLLQGAVAFGGAWALMARPWNWLRDAPLEFAALDGLEPFRRVGSPGDLSGGGNLQAGVLVGISAPEPTDEALENRVRRDLRDLILRNWSGGGLEPVPVTYFTDIQCPVCRVLETRLPLLDGIYLTTREFPVFGEASERAARAILAAAEQGEGEELRRRFHRAPVFRTRAGLEAAIVGTSLDPDTFFAAMEGADVTARLAEDRAIARIFRIPGTPALTIGRSLLVGLPPSQPCKQC